MAKFRNGFFLLALLFCFRCPTVVVETKQTKLVVENDYPGTIYVYTTSVYQYGNYDKPIHRSTLAGGQSTPEVTVDVGEVVIQAAQVDTGVSDVISYSQTKGFVTEGKVNRYKLLSKQWSYF